MGLSDPTEWWLAVAEHVKSAGYVQADFLRALAGHVGRWDLVPVNILCDFRGGWCLHVFSPRLGEVSAGLAGWAQSLEVVQLTVRALLGQEQVNVRFSTSLGGCPVSVWGCVDPLREVLGLTEGRDTTITLAELVSFAEYGTVVQRSESCGDVGPASGTS